MRSCEEGDTTLRVASFGRISHLPNSRASSWQVPSSRVERRAVPELGSPFGCTKRTEWAGALALGTHDHTYVPDSFRVRLPVFRASEVVAPRVAPLRT